MSSSLPNLYLNVDLCSYFKHILRKYKSFASLDTKPKTWSMKEITDKLDFIKIENFSVKDSIKSKTGKKYL